MNDVKLYIGGIMCDMYQDEDITLTKQITDYEDPDKVLSNFTQSFTIPASPTNNGIFQHYYNLDIDGTFDPFAKVEAYLESNSLPIDNGIIELMSVNTNKHRPESYNIVFYGLVTGLKTLFGDDTLDVLDVSGLDHDLDYDNITDSWDLNLLSGNVVYPLVNFERPWIYSSTVNDDRNIAKAASGILVGELKPAVRLKYIWDSIFNHYGLTYTSDIVDASGTFNGLYMLMHRDGGDLNDVVLSNQAFSYVHTYNGSIVGTGAFEIDMTSIIIDYNGYIDLTGNTYTAPLANSYDIHFNNISGNYTGDIPQYGYSVNGGAVNIVNTGATLGTFNFTRAFQAGDVIKFWVVIDGTIKMNTGTISIKGSNTPYGTSLDMSNLWPKDFKVRDFIDSVLKMFGLIVVPDGVNNFLIENKQVYYQDGEIKDWNKYINIDNVKYSKVPVFKDISFEYSEAKDMPQEVLRGVLGRSYSSSSFQTNLLFASESLKVETSFASTVLVEMVDQDVSGNVVSNTGIYINRMLDKDEKPVVDSPRIFYYDDTLKLNCSAYWLQDQSGNTAASFNSETVMPFCSMFTDLVADANTESFNFSLETPYGGIPPIKTLFQQYYSDYIQRLFDLKSRVVKVKAVIPLAEYVKLDLSDNIEFDGHYYVINKISYNLSTNMADIELISFFREKTYPSVGSSEFSGLVVLNDESDLMAKKELLYNITSGDYWRTFEFETAMKVAQRGQPTLLPMEGYSNGSAPTT